MGDVEDICYLPATELARLYRRRALSPVEAARATLARIERLNPSINAYITVTSDRALAQAHAAERAFASGADAPPLTGIPLSLKDLTVTRGIRTTRGSLLWQDWVPDEDAPIVERLYAAGGVLLGKTNTPEMGWKGDSGNLVVGPTHNPWRAGRTSGGSSGGAAAAVAAGMGPLAQGTDGAGSVRIPASFCGVFGLKPSFGLVPYYPPSSVESLAHVGPITRTVEDAALFLNVMAGFDRRDRLSLNDTGSDFTYDLHAGISGLRVAWSPDLGYAPLDPEVRDITARAARVFTDLGCDVDEVTPGWSDPYPALDLIWATSQAAAHAQDFEQVRDRLDPGRAAVIEAGRTVSGLDLAVASQERIAFADRVRGFMDGYDLLLTPTLPVTAFAAGDDHPGDIGGSPTSYLGWTKFTYPFNLSGQPAATVPCGFASDGLPVGLQIVGRLRDDALVLRAAASFERARPWAERRPDLA
ncbi:MAG TPA: amidase [Thermomicrobiaceae bacterium]|nr:amidase [Thermomicrobiaceae bacterium]